MLLIYLILGTVLIFQAGTFWTAYKIDLIEGRPGSKMIYWCVGAALFGLYFLISMIGRACEL